MYLFVRPYGRGITYGRQDVKLVEALLEVGADPKMRDVDGNGVLAYAMACCPTYASVAELRERGAVE
jgi:ankyrin repeat protein